MMEFRRVSRLSRLLNRNRCAWINGGLIGSRGVISSPVPHHFAYGFDSVPPSMRGGFASFSELLAQPGHCPGRFQSDSGLCPKVQNSPDGVHVRNSLFLKPTIVQRVSHNLIRYRSPLAGLPSGDSMSAALPFDLARPPVAFAAPRRQMHLLGIDSQSEQMAAARSWWDSERRHYRLFSSIFTTDEASGGDPEAAS
jgi:hypothetical protein